MFLLFKFSSIFPEGSADPICPYVRTPMDRTVVLKNTHRKNNNANKYPMIRLRWCDAANIVALGLWRGSGNPVTLL